MLFSIISSIITPAFAAETGSAKDIKPITFIDAEGKSNSVYISISSKNKTHVEHYIDGVLLNTVDVALTNYDPTRIEDMYASITYTDATTQKVEQSVEPVSKYIATPAAKTTPVISAPNATSFVYQGKINYNTCYDPYANPHNYSLSVYQQTLKDTFQYKTINAELGSLVSKTIGVVSAVLLTIFLAPETLVAELVLAAASSLGVNIVDGAFQKAFVKNYYVHIVYYKVKAVDSTNRAMTFDANRYQVALEGGGYSSTYYYEGYLPWRSNEVAYWLFCDFWTYNYPGVKNFS